MIEVAVAGASGRMGRAIVTACQSEPALTVVHAIERSGSDVIATDVGVLAGIGDISVPVSDDIGSVPFDVLIEFTNPAATVDHVRFCREQSRAMVIGTTGLDDDDHALIVEAAATIPIVLAPNMSVGVNLTFKLLEIAARTLGDSVDIEIVEAHHRHKVDAPSGTALAMGEAVTRAVGTDLAAVGVFSRHGQIGARPAGAIGFSTIRGGDIVGEHKVMFINDGECVEIVHKASSRTVFATGALRAARWVAGRAAGLYSMQDVLGLADD